MYKVMYQNCRAKQFKNFKTYDEARNAVRRYIRKQWNWTGPFKSNPPISEFGFSVVKV